MVEFHFKIKSFEELSATELYEIIQLRVQIFVIEQNCPYQDLDGNDQKSLHLCMYNKDNLLVAYCRLVPSGIIYDEPGIGRVVVHEKFRNLQLGRKLMVEAIELCKKLFSTKKITISAQLYLEKFYASLGFIKASDMYLEDGIPHIKMKLENTM